MRKPRHEPMVVRLEGPSGSGKTTLLLRLIRKLRAEGVRVGAVKGCHHTPVVEPRGKDSARMRSAGADVVAVAGPGRHAIVARSEGRVTLRDLLERLPPVDVVLVEGFRDERLGLSLDWRERRDDVEGLLERIRDAMARRGARGTKAISRRRRRAVRTVRREDTLR